PSGTPGWTLTGRPSRDLPSPAATGTRGKAGGRQAATGSGDRRTSGPGPQAAGVRHRNLGQSAAARTGPGAAPVPARGSRRRARARVSQRAGTRSRTGTRAVTGQERANPRLAAALRYAAAAWPVFPCVPGEKIPVTRHGFLDASTDPDKINWWWSRNPD